MELLYWSDRLRCTDLVLLPSHLHVYIHMNIQTHSRIHTYMRGLGASCDMVLGRYVTVCSGPSGWIVIKQISCVFTIVMKQISWLVFLNNSTVVFCSLVHGPFNIKSHIPLKSFSDLNTVFPILADQLISDHCFSFDLF